MTIMMMMTGEQCVCVCVWKKESLQIGNLSWMSEDIKGLFSEDLQEEDRRNHEDGMDHKKFMGLTRRSFQLFTCSMYISLTNSAAHLPVIIAQTIFLLCSKRP